MKKYRAEDYWFEIGQAPDASGRVTRCYIVRCRKCKATASHHATKLPDEGFRKIFTRQGWQIGKNRNQHICATCSSPVRKPEPTPPAPVTIRQVWDNAKYDDRRMFVKWLIGNGWQENFKGPEECKQFVQWMEYAGWIPAADVALKMEDLMMRPPDPAPPAPPPEQPRTPHLTIVAPVPKSEPEPEPEPEVDEPADWWRELMAK